MQCGSPIIFALIFLSGCGMTEQGKPGFDIQIISVGKGPGSVEVADLNKDHLPDLIVANGQDSNISILLNQGHRQFKPAAGSPFLAGNFPNDINIADLNKDDNLDLAIANHERKQLTVLLGNGKGQFQPAPRSPFFVAVKPHTHGVISADFNGDGNLDLATDSWGVDSIVILSGDGKGNFSNPIFYATGKHPYQRLRTADLNQDNHPDIVSTNLDGNTVTVLLGDGKGNFSRRFFDAGNTPFGLAIGDLNGDGYLDLAIVNAPTISSGKPGKDGLTILYGDGKGGFTTLQGSPFDTGLGPTRVAIGDLDADGINDIAVSNYGSKYISIFYMGKKGLISATTLPLGNHADGIAIADLDGDGKNDIIAGSAESNSVTLFYNNHAK
jgi:hypothetical protein